VCGGWYKLLAPHLAPAHGMSSADYRLAYRLPRKLSLRAAELTAAAREQGIARYANRPDVRANLADGHRAIDRANVAAGSRASAAYEMVREARRRGGQGKRAAARRRMDDAAHVLGYADIAAYFADRQGAAIARMARELGISRPVVTFWRGQCGPPPLRSNA
jgi:hypothetical protein